MATALVKAPCAAERDVELRRQQAIVHLLRESVLTPSAIYDKTCEFMQAQVLTKDVCVEVQAMFIEKGITRGGEVGAAVAPVSPVSSSDTLTTSRFDQAFERLELLGRGGFGEVWRVRSRVDRKEYAVKMVPYKYSEHTDPYDHPALREARHWASFNEPGAVRYHSSWLEIDGEDDDELPLERTNSKALTEPEKSTTEESEDAVTARSEWTYTGAEGLSSGPVVFVEDTSGAGSSVVLPPPPPNSKAYLEGLEVASPKRRRTSTTFTSKPRRATLFIQTELVRGGTLRGWIDRRNAALVSGAPLPAELCAKAAEDIFRQCVDAVSSLHAQGLVHRDIKPGNVLLTEEGGVRLADFGLATKDTRAWPESSSTMTHDWADAGMQDGEHTSGVGTKMYASPEQWDGRRYDNKADIYALGMVMAELLYPVRTHMERSQLFDRLRCGLLPMASEPIRPEATELLLQMLSEDPELRPAARDLAQMLHQRAAEHGDDAESTAMPSKAASAESFEGDDDIDASSDVDAKSSGSFMPTWSEGQDVLGSMDLGSIAAFGATMCKVLRM